MKETFSLISSLISDPLVVNSFQADDWNQLVSQARFHDLIPFIRQLMLENKLLDTLPVELIDLMAGYQVRLEYQQKLFQWESTKLAALAQSVDYPVIILKGAAYLFDHLSTFQSREFADIDILVAADNFKHFESLLLDNKWEFRTLNDYDDHYYREWSHASPPMINLDSGIELDLHHSISSPISDTKINTSNLMTGIQEINNTPFYRLSDIDLVLHCANHFIYFDDLKGRVKDLIFIHYFILDQQNKDQLWLLLQRRAEELGLTSTFIYMALLLKTVLQHPIPKQTENRLNLNNPGTLKKLVVWLLKNCITPSKAETIELKIYNLLLIVRYQWSRYPIHILMTHLWKKHVVKRSLDLLGHH